MASSGTNATRSQQGNVADKQFERKRLLDELEFRGYRLTNQRRVLIEELENADRHLDANELLERAHFRDALVDRATVYRTLDLLKKLGLVDELDLMHLHGAKHCYEVRTGRDHIHLACFGCGKILQVTDQVYDELKSRVQRDTEFSIKAIRLEIGGNCRECRAKGAARGRRPRGAAPVAGVCSSK